jgi:hypothetical protein
MFFLIAICCCELGLEPIWIGPDGEPGHPLLVDTADTSDTGHEER